MRYEVDINGRVRQVDVHRVDGRFAVVIDGREWHVDAAPVDGQTLSLLVEYASHDVTITPDPASGRLAVRLRGVPLDVGLNGRRRRSGGDDEGAASAPQRLVAPMSGKVVRVLVQAGQPVRPRDPVVVIEAMKMENELRATRPGVVAELVVREGQSVDAGALLLVIGPA